jgi:hypothetical protein
MRYARVQTNSPPGLKVGQFVAVVRSALPRRCTKEWPRNRRHKSGRKRVVRGRLTIIKANRWSLRTARIVQIQRLNSAVAEADRRACAGRSAAFSRGDPASEETIEQHRPEGSRLDQAVLYIVVSFLRGGAAPHRSWEGLMYTKCQHNRFVADSSHPLRCDKNEKGRRNDRRPVKFVFAEPPIRQRPSAAGRARRNRGSPRPGGR